MYLPIPSRNAEYVSIAVQCVKDQGSGSDSRTPGGAWSGKERHGLRPAEKDIFHWFAANWRNMLFQWNAISGKREVVF